MAKSGVLRNSVRADPRAEDRETTSMLSRVGRLQGSGKTSVCFPNGTEVSLSALMLKMLQFSADELADGNAVTILSSDVALSQTEAADLLGLSRHSWSGCLTMVRYHRKRSPRNGTVKCCRRM